MNDDQRNRVNAYVRWGLTQIQAENWILSDIYPGHTIMKRCRKRRWAEKQGRDKNLNKALEASKEPVIQGPALQTQDLTSKAKEYLSEKAFAVLSNRSKTLTQKDDVGNVYKCIYLSCAVKKKNYTEGLKAICKDLNTLAEHDLIYSTLSPPSSIDLAIMALRDPPSAVYAFVLVPESKLDLVVSLVEHHVLEGDCGETISILEKELPEGEFLAVINISHFMHQASGISNEARLHNEIQAYLKVLPKGTEFVSVRNCSTGDLYMPFEVTFRNPLMKNYKEVRLQYIRECVVIDDDIRQFNLLVGVEYIKR
jgi:hypothetical protein